MASKEVEELRQAVNALDNYLDHVTVKGHDTRKYPDETAAVLLLRRDIGTVIESFLEDDPHLPNELWELLDEAEERDPEDVVSVRDILERHDVDEERKQELLDRYIN